ncbi:ferredoxin-type protein NapF, partial [Vibrio parahaemolyticus]
MVDLSRRRLFTRKTHTDNAVRLPWLARPEQ